MATADSSRIVPGYKGLVNHDPWAPAFAPTPKVGLDVGSPFEECFASKLGWAGYAIVRQIDVEGLRIDPADPDLVIAGIECGRVRYHSGLAIRDHDLIRRQGIDARLVALADRLDGLVRAQRTARHASITYG